MILNPNPLFTTVLQLAEEMERITGELQDFASARIVVARADNPILRREAMAEVARQISGRCLIREFNYNNPPRINGQPLRSVGRFCRTLVQQQPFCVFAHGLPELRQQASLARREKSDEEARQAQAHYEEALALLNMHREDIVYTNAALVLWVDEPVFTDLISQAGDFLHWKTSDACFEEPEASVRPTPLGQLSIETAERLRRDKRQVESLLNRDRKPNPTVLADLHRQLHDIRQQLGEVDDTPSQEVYEEFLRLGQFQRVRDDYCQQLIAKNEYLDFRGIPQTENVVRLRLEELFVPLCAREDDDNQLLSPLAERWAREETQQDDQDKTSADKEVRLIERDEVSRTRQVEFVEAWRDRKRLVVLGDPGSGKSTLLKLLAVTYARGERAVKDRFGVEDEARLPLLVPVAAFGEFLKHNPNVDFSAFLEKWAGDEKLPYEVVRWALEQGRCLLLLDGLDEVLDTALRTDVSRQVEEFIGACHKQNRVVVTSRIAGYIAVTFSGPVAHLTLLPFDGDRISNFARHWADAFEQSRNVPDWERLAAQRADSLTEAIFASPAVERLASTPLLLTILALIHQQGTQLPRRRVELYRLCVSALAETWNRARGFYKPIDLLLGDRKLDEPTVVGILAPIAFRLYQNEETGVLHRDDLVRQVRDHLVQEEGVKETEAEGLACTFIQLMREQSGLFIERGADLFDFMHPTFKEYFAARHLAARRDPLHLLQGKLFESRWREVILLTAGLLQGDHLEDFIRGVLESGEEVDKVLPRPLLLAARCAADNDATPFKLRKQIAGRIWKLWNEPLFDEMRDILDHQFAVYRGSNLAVLLAENFLALAQDVQVSDGVRRVAAHSLGLLGETVQAAILLLGLAQDCQTPDWVRRQAIHSLGQLRVTVPTIINGLLALAQDFQVPDLVRCVAAIILGRLGEKREAMALLLTLAQDSQISDLVRRVAAQALGRLGETIQAATLLLGLAQDPNTTGWVRRETARALAQLGETIQAGDLLLALVQDSKTSIGVRTAAVLALAQLGENVPAVIDSLLALAQDSKTPAGVRAAAARALGQLGENVPAVIDSLLALAQDSKTPAGVRAAAARALGQLGETREAVTLLLALVLHSQNAAQARRDAASTLGQLAEREPTIIKGLLAVTQAPKTTASVRAAAAYALGQLGETTQAANLLLAIAQDSQITNHIRRDAAAALWRLTGSAFESD